MRLSASTGKRLLIKYPLCKQSVATIDKSSSERGDAKLIANISWTMKDGESSCKKVSRNYNPDPLLSKVSFSADRLTRRLFNLVEALS